MIFFFNVQLVLIKLQDYGLIQNINNIYLNLKYQSHRTIHSRPILLLIRHPIKINQIKDNNKWEEQIELDNSKNNEHKDNKGIDSNKGNLDRIWEDKNNNKDNIEDSNNFKLNKDKEKCSKQRKQRVKDIDKVYIL